MAFLRFIGTFFKPWLSRQFTITFIPLRIFSTTHPTLQQLKLQISNLKSQHGQSSPYLIQPYNLLGIFYKEEGKLQQSLQYINKALQNAEFHWQQSIHFADLYTNLGHVHNQIGNLKQAIHWFKKAAYIQQTYLQPGSLQLGVTYSSLSSLLMDIENFQESIQYIKLAQPIMQANLQSQNINVGIYYQNYAFLSERTGDMPTAIDCYKKCLSIYKQIQGEYSPEIFRSHKDLYSIYHDIQDFDKALEELDKAIQVKQMIGPETDLINLEQLKGHIYRQKGNILAGIQSFQKALALAQSLEAPLTLIAAQHQNLAKCYYDGMENEKAWFHQEKVLEICVTYTKGIISEEQASTYTKLQEEMATTHQKLKTSFYKVGDWKKAAIHAQRVLAIRQSIYSTSEEDLAIAYMEIGIINHTQGKLQQSKSYYQQGIQVLKGTQFFQLIAYCKSRLVLVYNDLKEFDKAIGLIQEAIGIIEEKVEREGAQSGKYIGMLGVVYSAKKDYPLAIQTFKRAFSISEKVGDVKMKIRHLEQLGDVYRNDNQYENALKTDNEAFQLYQKAGDVFGMAQAQNNLGLDYKYKGDYEKGIQSHLQARKLFVKLYGEKHQYVGGCDQQVADLYSLIGNVEKAREILTDILGLFQELLGEDSEKVSIIRGKLNTLKK